MRYLYIDTENIGDYSFIKELNVSNNDTVILFVSDKSKRIKIEDVRILTESQAKILYEDVYVGETNALDFQLISLLSLNLANSNEDDEYLIVSNDNDYVLPVKYLVDKTSRNISLFKTSDIALSEEERDIILDSLPEKIDLAFDELSLGEDIIEMIKTSGALNILHNNLRNTYGNEDGRKIYMSLKPYIKSLYKAT